MTVKFNFLVFMGVAKVLMFYFFFQKINRIFFHVLQLLQIHFLTFETNIAIYIDIKFTNLLF